MALTDFFRINFPYGIRKNDNGEWFAFNREYMPLGSKDRTSIDIKAWQQQFIGVKYKGLTEAFLTKLAASRIERDGKGKISCIWFYTDATNPMNNPKYTDEYFGRLNKIGKVKENK